MSGHLLINPTLHKIFIRSFSKVLLLPVFQDFFLLFFLAISMGTDNREVKTNWILRTLFEQKYKK